MHCKLLAGVLLAATLIMSACTAKVDNVGNVGNVGVGFIYPGPSGDYGWARRHEFGRLAVVRELGVDTLVADSHERDPGADERALRRLIAGGSDIIFATTHDYKEPLLKVAAEFPGVRFEHAVGDQRSDNISVYAARFYEGRAVIGAIAGHMSKRGQAGYIASHPTPEVMLAINVFTHAMRQVNPEATVKVVWADTWNDADKEAQAAHMLIDGGADIIAPHTNSPAPLEVAEQRGVYAFGQLADLRAIAPNAQLTALIPNWDRYYVERVRAVMDGTWQSRETWEGLKTGMLALAPYGDAMPAEVRAAADRMVAGIIDGTLHPFEGPIRDRDGRLRVRAGEVPSDEALLGIDWYVEGVSGELPQ